MTTQTRHYQPVLPSIEVEVLEQSDLKGLLTHMKRNPELYYGTSERGVQDLTLNKHGLWELDLQPLDDGVTPRVYVVRPGHVLVTSQNGRRYVGEDFGQDFTYIPAELFHPVPFAEVEDTSSWDD